jgi:hypothetical protein
VTSINASLVTIQEENQNVSKQEGDMADKYNSKIAGFVGWLNAYKGGYAITVSKDTTWYSVPESLVDDDWRRHENIHKRQIKEIGWFSFMFQYFRQNLTVGYGKNKFEVEARKKEI